MWRTRAGRSRAGKRLDRPAASFASSLDDIDGTPPDDFGENACEAWHNIAMSDIPPKTSPAVLIARGPQRYDAGDENRGDGLGGHAGCPGPVYTRWCPAASEDAMDGILSDSQRWLSEGMPSPDQIQGRIAAVVEDIKDAGNEVGKRNAEFDKDDTEAAADRYGVILGYHDPNLDANIIFDTGDDNKRYWMRTTGFGGCWTGS